MTETKRKRTPRPRAVDEHGKPIPFARQFSEGEQLKKLLIEACPPEELTGAKSIPLLAKKIEVSKQALGQAMDKKKITPSLAQKVVDVADGRVSLSDLSPFIFR